MNNAEFNKPLVSIIIVAYNSSKYVIETLESAKAQSYKNIELIVTDDCSTDNTVEICRKWVDVNREKFVNVELITAIKNTGIAANANRGIKASKGEWLKFIAGDDLLLEDCIKDNLSFIQNSPDTRFVTSNLISIDKNGKLLKTESTQYDAFQKYYFSKSATKQLKIYARLPVFLNSPAFFIKRELIDAVENFDESFKIFEDICLIYRINSINERVFYFDKNTVKYRIHGNAISRCENSFIGERRKQEQISIFEKYRRKNLNKLNLIDLSVFYETWLNYKYKGLFGRKGNAVLLKFSLFFWYLKYLRFKV